MKYVSALENKKGLIDSLLRDSATYATRGKAREGLRREGLPL